MKQSMVLLAAIAGAATAQNLGSCAQLCINNMNMIANTQFSCPAGDQACFCSQSNWAYGVRDCSQQACDAEQAAQAIGYAQSQCQSVESSLGPSATASPSAALTILNPALSALSGASGSASGESASATGSASQSAITTVPLVGTVTNSDGSVMTTTSGFSTVYSSGALTGSAASAASSAASSVESELSSALSSAAESASSALASVTGSLASAASSATGAAGSAASSAASAAGSAASSAVPSGSAAKVTGLPVAAGLAFAAYFL
ncbi:hypothetical protein E8E12_007405 [Didymella heteroderae]|uniref:CFEM domain-containing protein n=1 Tax=Didymella heteroderae TaxID=1769908 RepID=A0A9P4X2D6_9PLEO|nr:hypothetical protein E8E12_007405 [Didymella heteroderae]